MEKTWKPMVAGILDIVSGALSFFALVLFILGVLVFMAVGGTDLPIQLGPALVLTIAIPILIADALAIVGGIYALKRKRWGWALAGCIAAVFLSWPLAIAAIVLTVMSKDEFE